MRYFEILPEADAWSPIKPLPPAKKKRPDAYQTPQPKPTRYQSGTNSRWQTPPVEKRAKKKVETDPM
jgi:hypothetical protein